MKPDLNYAEFQFTYEVNVSQKNYKWDSYRQDRMAEVILLGFTLSVLYNHIDYRFFLG